VWHLLEWAARPIGRLWRSDDALDSFALVHMASVAGDALLAIALADSVFFSLRPGAARGHVALYLGLTMAPLAVAAPALVPLLDRGGFRRTIAFASGASRAVVALVAAPNFHSLLLFPLSFVLLVLSRVHAITKNGLTVAYARHGEGLVQANARLNRMAAVVGVVVALPGIVALKIGHAPAVLTLAAAFYALDALLVLRLPRVRREAPTPAAPEEIGKRGAVPALAIPAAATAALRGANGFLVFLLAFALRGSGKPAYWFGVVIAAGIAGAFLGDVIAPRLEGMHRDEAVVLASLFVAGAAAFLAFEAFGLPLLAGFALLAGASTEFGRLAFQSLMQRTTPGGAQGRVFVRYEVLFQMAWVVGGFVPSIVPIPFRTGILLLAAFYVVLGVAFLVWPRLPRQREAQRVESAGG
jgi:hypothetical protein